MLNYLFYIIISVFLYTSFTYAKSTCKKIQTINTQLSEKNIHIFPIIKNFVYSYVKYVLTSCLQKYNLNVVKKTPQLYEIFYTIDGTTYCFKVKKKKGPSDVLMVTTKNENKESEAGTEIGTDKKTDEPKTNCIGEEDVSDKVMMYMGPNQDFYNIQTKVKDLGYTNLTFYLSNSDEKIFCENDYISF